MGGGLGARFTCGLSLSFPLRSVPEFPLSFPQGVERVKWFGISGDTILEFGD